MPAHQPESRYEQDLPDLEVRHELLHEPRHEPLHEPPHEVLHEPVPAAPEPVAEQIAAPVEALEWHVSQLGGSRTEKVAMPPPRPVPPSPPSRRGRRLAHLVVLVLVVAAGIWAGSADAEHGRLGPALLQRPPPAPVGTTVDVKGSTYHPGVAGACRAARPDPGDQGIRRREGTPPGRGAPGAAQQRLQPLGAAGALPDDAGRQPGCEPHGGDLGAGDQGRQAVPGAGGIAPNRSPRDMPPSRCRTGAG